LLLFSSSVSMWYFTLVVLRQPEKGDSEVINEKSEEDKLKESLIEVYMLNYLNRQ